MFWKNKEKSMVKSQPIEHSYKREIIAVVLCAVFIFLTISCISYNPNDNSFFHYTNNNSTKITNWAGVIGAQSAALFFFLFGYAAFLFLLCGGFFAWLLFARIPLKQERGRIAALFLIFLPVNTMLSILSVDFFSKISGGFIGSWLSHWLTITLGHHGGLVLLCSTLWIGIILFTRMPLIPVFKYIGKFIKKNLVACWNSCCNYCNYRTRTKVITKSSNQENSLDFAFLGSVADRTVTDQTISKQEQPKQTEQIIFNNKWEEIQLRTTSIPRKLLKGFVYQLANTVSKKNFLINKDFKIFQKEELMDKSQVLLKLPDSSIFIAPREKKPIIDQDLEIIARGKLLEEKLLHFGVKGKVTYVKTGPFITMFEYKPEIDSKISKITALEDDLAMALTANSIRILAPIPGKDVVGFEIANLIRQDVYFSEILASKEYHDAQAILPLVFGVNVAGTPVIQDLVRMPHLLIGGSTGSGKSVGLNAMIAGLLNAKTPDQMKIILIDPKRLEFTHYAHVPHLIFPIITEPTKATAVLKWVCQEMEARYETMSKAGVRNIQEYQKLFEKQAAPNDRDGKLLPHMSFLIVVIDELADLMMVAGKEIETAIVRIAQMARASGIHMIVATQRPSVDVVTGLIKVNFPSRIAFRVSSKVDSRTILDQQGAEKLLGRGDMLYLNASSPDLTRIHGAYVSDDEINNLANWWRNQQEPTYLDLNEVLKSTGDQKFENYQDDLYKDVLEFIKTNDEVSISMIQRYFRIGFNRSARLIEKLELDGIIAPSQGAKPRKVLR